MKIFNNLVFLFQNLRSEDETEVKSDQIILQIDLTLWVSRSRREKKADK